MRAVQTDPEQLRRIWRMAELLGGEELGEERGNALAEMAVNAACAFCNRSEVPEAMEQAVARLVLELKCPQGSVSTVQRGDTAVTYKAAQNGAQTALRPFCRLGTVEAEDA